VVNTPLPSFPKHSPNDHEEERGKKKQKKGKKEGKGVELQEQRQGREKR